VRGWSKESEAEEYLKFLRSENGVDVYLDIQSGKEIYLVRNDGQQLEIEPNTEIKNSKLNGNRMEVLGLVSIQLPELGWWSGDDIEDMKTKGAIFRAYAEGQEEGWDIGYIIVADVTGNPQQLNISSLDEGSAKDYDLYLHKEAQKALSGRGMEIIEWRPSQLDETEGFKRLVTTYIVKDEGRERQNIALRMRVRQSNLVIMGCFDIAMKDQLAAPIFDAIRSFLILPPDAEV
jgi:hypothetical protein